MALTDVMKLIDQCSREELRVLREYIQEREQQMLFRARTVDMEAFLNELDEIKVGMSEEEFAEIERAMNAESLRDDGG